ncbi:MAG: isopentenyl-diphosphate Delta-isomerase [Xanthobacteraceae bacterium]|nr:MAG: isopentenyl-diphosphate Delta-isomerase [Xanthobacteraceae bacterium]
MSDENLILVDERNRAVGTATKHAVHRDGLLHRAFSIFLVDSDGRLLLQRRHPRKYHSGGLWANSCCGHPRVHEPTLRGARRRLGEELGISAKLRFGFFARYRAELDNGMHENEFVYVYFGEMAGPVIPNADEIIDIDFLTPHEIARAIAREPHSFTYWLKYYFQAHATEIDKFAALSAGAHARS